MSLASWLASPPPDAAVEIAPGRVSVAAITSSFGGDVVVSGYAVEQLPEDAVVASLTSHNVADRRAVATALRTALGRLGTRASRVALVIPDIAAKVSLLRFDKVPDRRGDLDQLVRWQLRKSAPFAVEDACVTYTPGARNSDGSAEFIVVLARRDVVEGYEGVCQDAGCYAGLVDLATFSVVNLFLASGLRPESDWLAVHMRPEYTSISIMRGDDMIFFRNRHEGEEESLADLVHQTAMYYQDRLSGRGFARAVIGGMGRTAGSLDQARANVQERLDLPVDVIDPTKLARLSDRIGATPDLKDVLSPLIGILLRARVLVSA
jgi:Tfp pilus assembly PilM family ATPase